MTNKTKIIATIGPSSNTRPVLKKLIFSGMNVARLNFSHGKYEEHGEVINTIRSLSREMNRPVAIMLDLQGPKIRTGKLKDGKAVLLKKNNTISITTKKVAGTADVVSTTYNGLPADVTKGDKILIDDGLMELQVISSNDDTVTCKVVNGGLLKENKGINLPGVNVSTPSLTAKDKKDLNFGIQVGVDYLALSFVRSADDLKQIKALIKKKGTDIPVVAKIEKPEAVDNIDKILKVADVIMVARGDLGVEMKPEKVPNIQKHIIHKAIRANKPVITATQMLETMSINPIPTRAEASDVANAIFDGTDAIMLSGETASGEYPVKAVQMMKRIAVEAEKSEFMKYNLQYEKDSDELVTHAVAKSAVDILHEVSGKAIIAFSISGNTSKFISKHRPSMPVYSFTSSMSVYNRLSLVWGLTPSFISDTDDTKKIIEAAERILINKKLIKKDDLVIIVTGLGLRKGSTNIIKIHRVGQKD
ncbi:MAG: pyruvate kinase [Deltaproteobacteria bacterium]|nr:pyruvate kinase [Deltaproteobacteria bacterium]